MIKDLGLVRMASALAAHSTTRQSLLAENIANADTPGYRARDLHSFSDAMDSDAVGARRMRATRAGHIGAVAGSLPLAPEEITAFGAEAPNGNNVSLEDQMMRATEVEHNHKLALGIYKTSLDILRLGLGRGR